MSMNKMLRLNVNAIAMSLLIDSYIISAIMNGIVVMNSILLRAELWDEIFKHAYGSGKPSMLHFIDI